MTRLSTLQIGKCGELLVQYRLLMLGIESSRMTTDTGIDLVAFSGRKNKAVTIQVKSKQRPTPGGGKGKLSLDWWVRETNPAELLAFTELEAERVRLIKSKDLPDLAQQHPKGRYHFCMATDPTNKKRKDGKAIHIYEFEKFLLENQAHKLL